MKRLESTQLMPRRERKEKSTRLSNISLTIFSLTIYCSLQLPFNKKCINIHEYTRNAVKKYFSRKKKNKRNADEPHPNVNCADVHYQQISKESDVVT